MWQELPDVFICLQRNVSKTFHTDGPCQSLTHTLAHLIPFDSTDSALTLQKKEEKHFKDHVWNKKKRSERRPVMIFVIVPIFRFFFYVMNVSAGGKQEDLTALFQAVQLHRVNLT